MKEARLAGKTAVVTGASSGIGSAIALRFAEAGARVVIHYNRNADKAKALAAKATAAGHTVQTLQADLTVPEEIHTLIHDSWKLWDGVDIWVNNAGADILTNDPDSDPEKRLYKLWEVDLLGTIRCCWQVVPLMKKAGHGVLLNMSWDLFDQGMPGRNPEIFSAIKGGVSSFSRSLAMSVAPHVRVNVLAPGWIETSFAKDSMTKAYKKNIERQTPLGRLGQPEEVADMAVYLASDEAAFISGQVFKVNGGLS